jgi:hemerythrin superfamily protein
MLTLEMAIQKIQQFTPEQRNKVIEFIEFLEFQSSQTENIDQQTNKEPQKISFAEAAHGFMGCLDSDIEDLSHNPQYLEGFGK